MSMENQIRFCPTCRQGMFKVFYEKDIEGFRCTSCKKVLLNFEYLTPEEILNISSDGICDLAENENLLQEVWFKIPYSIRLVATMFVFKKVLEHFDKPGTYRKLIYDRLGFYEDAYQPLYMCGGMEISNMACDLKTFNLRSAEYLVLYNEICEPIARYKLTRGDKEEIEEILASTPKDWTFYRIVEVRRPSK